MMMSTKRRLGKKATWGVVGLLGLCSLLAGCVGPSYALPAWLTYTAVFYDFALIPVRSFIGGIVLDFINGAIP